jgi:hypothetical protein
LDSKQEVICHKIKELAARPQEATELLERMRELAELLGVDLQVPPRVRKALRFGTATPNRPTSTT